MKTIGIIILLASLSANAYADDMLLDISLHAHHWDREIVKTRNLNETNPGIGLEFKSGEYRKMFGFYKNSERNLSGYALIAWTPLKAGPAEIGVFGGVVTGYIKPYIPATGLFAAVQLTRTVNLNITAVPTIQSMNVWGFAAFQLVLKF